MKQNILIIDDEEDILSMYKAVLKKVFPITTTSSGKKGLNLIKEGNYNLVLLDIIMPEINGIEVLKKIKSLDTSIEVIMVTASKDIRLAVEALKAGAYDYIIKPFEKDGLISTMSKALEHQSLLKENTNLKRVLKEKQTKGEIIGKSPRIQNIIKIIDMVSQNNSTILITGESGSGKEVIAMNIHKRSNRNNKPFIAINCAAIPENLLESELFGYEKGAFTGASDKHIGKFELANEGTLFLDEIGEMPHAMQAKLLRVIEENSIYRVGGEKSVPINTRIIAATNINIKKAVEEKRFRSDLFYRLNVIPIELPSLKERKEDISLFIDHFTNKYNKELNKNIRSFSSDAIKVLKNYSWPGNIRELENLIERLITLSNTDKIEEDDLPSELLIQHNETITPTEGLCLKEALEHFEKTIIKKSLIKNEGNQTRTAKDLSIHRTTLISKMEYHNLRELNN